METEMLYRIMDTVSTFYYCHKDEISKEYAKELDEQSKALLSMIKEQNNNNDNKVSWAEFTKSKYYKRYFKEKDFKNEVHNLDNNQLLQFWDLTDTSIEYDVQTIKWVLLEEISKRFPVEYKAWINGSNPEYTELSQYVLHSKRKVETISIIF